MMKLNPTTGLLEQSVKGTQGEPGSPGSPGAPGSPGTNGTNGTNGTDGSNSTLAAFGASGPVNIDYVGSRGYGIISNATGLLGNNYNFTAYDHDPITTPGIPGSFRHTGYSPGMKFSDELMAIDPNGIYKLGVAVRQEGLPGYDPAPAIGERQIQYIGIAMYDIDKNNITASTHMVYQDLRTTLAQDLTPGDTTVYLTDATGFDHASTKHYHKGLIVFAHKNVAGYQYKDYSRKYKYGLWDSSADVNTTLNTISLNQGFPSSIGNPDHAEGTWPAGTVIACSSAGGTYKYCFASSYRVAETDKWYQLTNWIGGTDRSGTNVKSNFSPGTAFVKLFTLANYSNRIGGWNVYPDTGPDHKVWFAGWSILPDLGASLVPHANGSQIIKVVENDGTSTSVATAAFKYEEI